MEEHIKILEITSNQTKLGDVHIWNFLLSNNNDVKLADKTGFFTSNWLHLYDTNIKHVYIILSIINKDNTLTVDHITGIAVGVIYNTLPFNVNRTVYTNLTNRTVWIDWLWSDPSRKLKGRGTLLLRTLEEKLKYETIYVISLDSCIDFYAKYGYHSIKYDDSLNSNKDIFSFSKPCTWQLMAKGVLNSELVGNDLHEFKHT